MSHDCKRKVCTLIVYVGVRINICVSKEGALESRNTCCGNQLKPVFDACRDLYSLKSDRKQALNIIYYSLSHLR
jgi:hypothetical protein